MINLEYNMIKGLSPLINTNMSIDEFFTTILIMSLSMYVIIKFLSNEKEKDSKIAKFIERLL